MKTVLFFITHKTLGEEHARATFYSIQKQSGSDMFDEMYIYNSHQEELSNEFLLELCGEYNISSKVRDIKVFPYQQETNKSLGADYVAIMEFCKHNYDKKDRILILKSDCVLSKNYFKDLFSIPEDLKVFFVAPKV